MAERFDLIRLEFDSRYHCLMQQGLKTSTFRKRFFGKVGDVFACGFSLYRVEGIEAIKVWDVCDCYHLEEGFSNSTDMRSALMGHYGDWAECDSNIGVMIRFCKVGGIHEGVFVNIGYHEGGK